MTSLKDWIEMYSFRQRGTIEFLTGMDAHQSLKFCTSLKRAMKKIYPKNSDIVSYCDFVISIFYLFVG